MADSVFRHTDDNGTLSVFASGDEVLFACSKGHWWIVTATSSGRSSKAATERAKRGLEIVKPTAADRGVRDLTARFGPDILNAMKFQ